MQLTYQEFLASKSVVRETPGIDPVEPHSMLFPFQRDIVKWALRRGRACIWADCGLGKTFMQLEWARQIPGKVLIVAPLNVCQQTITEAAKLGIDLEFGRSPSAISTRIGITNYESLENFVGEPYEGVALDEASILKNFAGKTRNLIIGMFAGVKFRTAYTATPSPNDHMELGNQAEYVGAMTRSEMLSMFFVHDGGETSKWRLKGHAQGKFWEWVSSWAVMMRKPSDLGYDDGDFTLPPLIMHEHIVETEKAMTGYLLPMPASSLCERRDARRSSLNERVEKAAQLANGSQMVFWCNLNVESEMLAKRIGAREIRGSTSMDDRMEICNGFLDGSIRYVVTKPDLWGYGLNLQCCHKTACVGLSDSYEDFYQLIRRFWRFGQKNPVEAHIIISDMEGAVLANIKRKEADANVMAEGMVKLMHTINEQNLKGTMRTQDDFKTHTTVGKNFTLHLGDCVDVVKSIRDDSIGFSVFSPPFASLYTYSASERDFGNSKSAKEFQDHFYYLCKELGRVMMPGRLVAIHCFDIPSMKERDGVIGLKDFSNEIRLAMVCHGFIYHSRVTIWKNPVTQMQRTKALGLLHKTILKDSSMSRQGLPDYLIVMRKNGENLIPIAHSHETFPVDQWQRWASPVWMDIDPGDTLQKDSARDEQDERHICPLQLEVIRRAFLLWSNPGDTVLSPFAGIGSEGYVALTTGRKFVGAELKESYFKQAVANLEQAEKSSEDDLFVKV